MTGEGAVGEEKSHADLRLALTTFTLVLLIGLAVCVALWSGLVKADAFVEAFGAGAAIAVAAIGALWALDKTRRAFIVIALAALTAIVTVTVTYALVWRLTAVDVTARFTATTVSKVKPGTGFPLEFTMDRPRRAVTLDLLIEDGAPDQDCVFGTGVEATYPGGPAAFPVTQGRAVAEIPIVAESVKPVITLALTNTDAACVFTVTVTKATLHD